MKRFTTPHFTFELEDFDISLIKCLRVYFEQKGNLILTKETEHCTFDGNTIEVKLTQDETALFDCTKYARIQLHILTLAGEALLSDPYNVNVGECLGNEVIS